MITNLHIHNFKCFADQSLPLAPLTLFVGANASGKSSAIQSLLLLRQSHWRGALARGKLLLNEQLVNVGTVRDALYRDANDDELRFTLTQESGRTDTFTFLTVRGETSAYSLNGAAPSYDEHMSLFSLTFNYLNAERIGPRLLYPMPNEEGAPNDVGVHGEYTAHVLAQTKGAINEVASIANQALLYQVETQSNLIAQTQLWMRDIIPNFELDVESLSNADQVQILFGNQGTGELYRPTNIGFGLIYTLPIIVAALVAPPGSLLIVENPEAHLHPASQSAMGHFLARVAAADVQVIIETHSDHVLNGLRRAVRDTILGPDQTAINYFVAADDQGPQRVHHPKMYSNGGIRPWPKGFFDQFERDLRKLL